MEQFKGKVAVVTGASSGMGRAAALRFAAGGAKVAITADKNIAGAEETARLIREAGGEALFSACDIADRAQVKAFFDLVAETWGRLDILFCNAGIGAKGLTPIYEYDDEEWDRILAVDLFGVYHCLKYGLQHMIRFGNGGAVVNNASAGAIRPMPGDSAYAAAKRGVVSLTITTAVGVGQFGIRVNCICPSGTLGTNLTAELESNKEAMAHMIQTIPLNRYGTVEDVADTVEWLCSDKAKHITGEVLCIDGGQLKR